MIFVAQLEFTSFFPSQVQYLRLQIGKKRMKFRPKV